MAKTRINISIDQDLVTQHLLTLKRRVDWQDTENILSHPAFQEAMEQVQTRLWDGSAKWYSYDEVFYPHDTTYGI